MAPGRWACHHRFPQRYEVCQRMYMKWLDPALDLSDGDHLFVDLVLHYFSKIEGIALSEHSLIDYSKAEQR
jgi:hypothetical protein